LRIHFRRSSLSKKTLTAAKETGNDVIVQVKGNQPTLLDEVGRFAENSEADDVRIFDAESGRNRIENRKAEVFRNPSFSDSDWDLVKSVIRMERFREVLNTKTKVWNKTHEISFYISTAELTAEEFGTAIRRHWGIENKNHYVRDVSMGEDASRIRVNPGIMAKLKSFALNIMRADKVRNIKQELFKNAMNIANIWSYTGIRKN
jgi:predicted transposase YbfD/YdcC